MEYKGKQMVPELKGLQIVPEEMVQFCAKQLVMMGEPDNTFSRFLETAREIRLAGLTPVFLCTETLQDMILTTEEKLKKKLH